MQYVACKFRETDSRTYTYHYDGDEELASGDQVKVADNRDPSAWKRVHVVSITDEQPSFPTKPILGKVEPEPEEQGGLDILDIDQADIRWDKGDNS